MKKLIKIFLICTLMLLALCVTASAATEGYYTYEVSNDEATITNVDTSIAGEVTIPSTLGGYPVTTIGENAFYWCTGLTSVEIGDSVTTIGGYAFDYCGKLTSIEVSENNSNYCSDNGILFSKSKETLVYYPVGKKDASYIIPESVTTIGRKAFYNCDSLTSIEIPGSVTIIGEEAFNYCDVLTSVVIPDSVTTIGDLAFSCCGSLTSIEVSENNFNYCSDNGILFSKNKETLICYPSGKSNTSYTVANGVTTIGGGAFSGCDYLTSVEIADSVTTIGKKAFASCTSLTSIKTGNSITTIGDNVFAYCINLKSIEIPDSVITIGDSAFFYCTGLKSVELGDGIMSIGKEMFVFCLQLSSVEIGCGVTTIDDSAFYNCINLASIKIPNSVKTIGDDAFYGCKSLQEVNYAGDETQWAKIIIGEGNDKLLNANIIFLLKSIEVEFANYNNEPTEVLFVTYDTESKLLDIKQKQVDKTQKQTVAVDNKARKYKIFYWESLANLKPVYEPISKEF